MYVGIGRSIKLLFLFNTVLKTIEKRSTKESTYEKQTEL